MTLDYTALAEARQMEADFWAAKSKPQPPPSPSTTAHLWASESIWNQQWQTDTLRDLHENGLAAYIDADMRSMGVRSIWTRRFVVPNSTPRKPVIMLGYGPSYDPAVNPPLEHLSGLRKVLAKGVPIPDHFTVSPDAGVDHTASIEVPETGEYFEFYYAGQVPQGEPNAGAWYTVGGGAIKDYRRFHGGGFDETAYPIYSTGQHGTRASGFPLMAGVATIEELWSGHIPHAVAWCIPYPKLGWVAEPARRTDATAANTDQYAVSYGYRYRWNIAESEIRAMSITPLAKTLLVAMAEYGFIPVDRTQNYCPVLEDGYDNMRRHGGKDAFSEVIDGNPPLFRSSDTPTADGTYALTPYQQHFAPLWLNVSKLQVARRVLTWPARPADNAY